MCLACSVTDVAGPGRTGLGQARQVIASIAVSAFGTWAYNVGIAVYAYERTHSAAWVAVVTVGRYVPALVLSWLVSRLVDRLPRRGLAVAADLLCAAVMVLLAALGAAAAPLWLITMVAAVSSTLARIQAAGVLSLAADVVVESQLVRASVLAGAAEAVATAAGSAAGSLLLIPFTAPTLFVVNAVSFVASAALLASIRGAGGRRRRARPDSAQPSAVTSGVVSLIWPLVASRAVVACVYGFDVVLLTVIASRALHGTSGYGWLLSAAGVGGLLAVVLVGRTEGRRIAPVASLGLLLYALPLVLFALDPPIAAGIPVQIARGIGSVVVTSTLISGLQRAVPSPMAGRVFGMMQSLVLAGTCLGAVAAPILLAAAGYETALVVAAVVPIALQLLLFPGLHRFDRRQEDLVAALEPRLATLRSLRLLHAASRGTLYEIADGIVELWVGPNTVIVREGDEADALYILVAGAVEVTALQDGQPVVLRRMTAPDYFGEIGLIHGVPRTATVTATDPADLWKVPAEVFLSAVAEAGVSGALSDTMHVRFETTAPEARTSSASNVR